MSKLAHWLSTVPELGAVNLSVRNGKSTIQFGQRANATLITEFNRKIINWLQCLNRNRAMTVPDTAPNGIEFGAVKARLMSKLRRCLHDTRSSFIPVRLHPGSILSIYICLHDTNQNCITEWVIPERLHPDSRIGSKFSFQNEICLHVPPVSCKGGMGSFRYGNKQVDWLGWPADSCFRSVDAFAAFSFQNENVHVNVKQTMRVVLEWNSFRYHVNTT